MLVVKFKLRESELNKLKAISEKGYPYHRTTTTEHLPNGDRREYQLIEFKVPSKAVATEIADLIQHDVEISTTQLIKFIPEITVQAEIEPTKVPVPRDLAELLVERKRNMQLSSKVHNAPTWSYAVRNSDGKASDLVWHSQGNCIDCGSFHQNYLCEIDNLKVVLCNTCSRIKAHEGDIVMSYGRLETAVKNLHQLNSIPQVPNIHNRTDRYRDAVHQDGEEL